MVYRSSRRQAQRENEAEGQNLHNFAAEPDIRMEKSGNLRRQVGVWRTAAFVLGVVCIGLIVGIAVLATREKGGDGDGSSGSSSSQTSASGVSTCGHRTKSAMEKNRIDLREPTNPGPFHDLTKLEIQNIREFIEKDPKIRAIPPEKANMTSSYMYMMDLYRAKKSSVLEFLDKGGKQPERQALVLMYRGDLPQPMVEEYICGPLPDVQRCELLKSKRRRNPIEFSLRPLGIMEFASLFEYLFPKVDQKIGYILKELYGTSYVDCKPSECFQVYPSPLATNLAGKITMRRLWVWAEYPLEYYALHPMDFGLLCNLDGSNPDEFSVDQVWFRGQIYTSLDDFIVAYNNTGFKDILRPPKNTKDLFSSMNRRGPPKPEEPQRPPTMVEPDGKRYSIKDRKVEYLGWTFNFRMSALTGPALYDIRYDGERIAYELALSEIAVFYSANNPLQRVTDFIDSGALIGSHSKSLVPGGDCPESATFINQTFSGQVLSESVVIERAFCLFENNNGYPVRRHLSFSKSEGAFYNGMLDSVLTLRSALTIVNYDYIVDFIFHQNGVVEHRIMSTGYIFPSFYNEAERPYGFQIHKNLIGGMHHHIFHIKADLDISGTSNRYETLDIEPDVVAMRAVPGRNYHQTRYEKRLKETEQDALYKFNFDTPKYHIVHNEAAKTDLDEIKAFRISLEGMSKQLLPEGVDNEVTIPWARHQLVVTKHHDDEVVSSSPYAMWDSADPVTDFSEYYADNENIVDEDLVFWITEGLHHIPHTEDLPVTPTVGNHLKFFLLPYNYFKECPSMSSRDQIRVEHKDKADSTKGVKVERNGNSYDSCSLPQVAKEYDELVEKNPDIVLESRKQRGLF